jgi:hypothetical protein
MQCEDCGRRTEADESEGWVAVRLESDRGVEVLTYCEDCAKQFEWHDISPIKWWARLVVRVEPIELDERNVSSN